MDLQDDPQPLPDTQRQRDGRGLAVQRAGVRGLRLPTRILEPDGRAHDTVATFELGVEVPATQRGTHMSRLVEAAHELAGRFELADLGEALARLAGRMDADEVEIAAAYTAFLPKQAPVSKRPSLLDVEVLLRGSRRRGQAPRFEQTVRAPVTTLCPCSKAISRYGAHNQRSTVSVILQPAAPVAVAALVAAIEAQASCAVYGVLKREDEKYVTEFAYDHAKFAEDLVRDLCAALAPRREWGLRAVETENHESIHNHSAYARVTRPD